MSMKNQDEKLRSSWTNVVDQWRPPAGPRDPRKFVSGILGYEFTRFHRRWWDFVSKNRTSLILAPRGHGKSTIVTVAFSLFHVLENPDLRVLIVSNTAAQAQAFLREIRHHLEQNHLIEKIWGFTPGTPWTENEISLASRIMGSKEATVTVMGMTGPVISRHYDLVILDDVVDEEAACSKHLRARIYTWYYKELLPTLEPGGRLHIIGTRYHQDDLYGKLIEAGVSALIERAIIGEGKKERALWEKKFPLDLLRKKRDQAGPAIFNAQYQNDVAAMKGRIFRPGWIRTSPLLPCPRKYQGVDLAIGQQDHNDYFAIVTVGEAAPGQYLVLDLYRDRLSFEDQFRAIVAIFTRHDRPESPVVRVGVEANAYQEALAQKLRAETMIPVKSITQTRDKIARAMRLQGLVQTGRLAFPEKGAHELIEELLAFPDADHDDLVDALEMAVRMACNTTRYEELPLKAPDFFP